MKSLEILKPVEWANRVNQTWIVHNNLNNSADDWMKYLHEMNDGRLVRSCEIARYMCRRRGPYDDPKPWFYAGLFHLATVKEAVRFLPNHRVTRSTVPAMKNDEEVRLWLDRINPETKVLLDRLEIALEEKDRGTGHS